MINLLFWECVQEDMELPCLVKNPTSKQLVKYAGASGDFYEIHYDKDFAQSTGLPGPILQGALKSAFLGQLITNWIGEHGTLKRLSCQYRKMDTPGAPLICKGKVVKKYIHEGEYLVDCEIWVENSLGERTTPGEATVSLPSRKEYE